MSVDTRLLYEMIKIMGEDTRKVVKAAANYINRIKPYPIRYLKGYIGGNEGVDTAIAVWANLFIFTAYLALKNPVTNEDLLKYIGFVTLPIWTSLIKEYISDVKERALQRLY